MLEDICKVIDEFEKLKKFAETDVWSKLREISVQEIEGENLIECSAEMMAFGFWENYRDEDTGWGLYYGPAFVLRDKDGNFIETPSIQDVTPEVIKYWSARAQEVHHPILQARYGDLAWEFSKEIDDVKPNYRDAQIVVDATLEIASKEHYKREIYIVHKLRRALSLALSLNDAERIAYVRDCIIETEDKVAIDEKPGLWGFSYDLLYNDSKITLSQKQRNKIVQDLEDRLLRLSETDQGGLIINAIESAGIRLAEHYRRRKHNQDVERVLDTLLDVFERASERLSPLQSLVNMQKLHLILLEYELHDKAEYVLKLIREIGPDVSRDMKELSMEHPISQEEIDKFVDLAVAGTFEEVLAKITCWFIPKKDLMEKQLDDLYQHHPPSFLISRQLVDGKGRTVAKLGNPQEDYDANLIHLMSQNFNMIAIIFRIIMERFIAEFGPSASSIVDYLYSSPIFVDSKREIIELGIQAYLDGSYISAVHLLIPQVEDILRKLVEIKGGSVLRQGKYGGYDYKGLNQLLSDPIISTVLGEDITLYFNALLTDQRGWNLRNIISHGIPPTDFIDASIADRVLHLFLCLALYREQNG